MTNNQISSFDSREDQEDCISGISPDQSDPSTKATALHVAVEAANLRAIQMLLQAGAQVNAIDLSCSTPLHIAAYMGYEEVRRTNRSGENRKFVSFSLDA